MPEERRTFRYRILRYAPNLLRDEWVNIGLLLEEMAGINPGAAPRRAARLIEEDADFARIRRLHPGVDERLLRGLADEFEARLREPEVEIYLQKLDQTLSNAVQFSPRRAVLATDFDAELERLFRDYVARPPARREAGIIEHTRNWIRQRLETILRRHRILEKIERGVRAEKFTQPGDPLRIDYAYRFNGTRGYMQIVPLDRHPSQAKVLAYTAECIRREQTHAEFIALTDAEPLPENRRHQFVTQLFAAQQIRVVPPGGMEKLAAELAVRLRA